MGVRERLDLALADLLPAVRMDGIGVQVVGIHGGAVRVRLTGTGASCPTTVWAMVVGIEEELRRRVPGVEHLEVVP